MFNQTGKLFLACSLFVLITSACSFGSKEPLPSSPDPNSPVVGVPGAGNDDPAKNSLEPQPGDEALTRGNAFINSAELLVMESYPVQIMLAVTGDKPTPCNSLRVLVSAPDDENRIAVDIYTLSKPGEDCVQVLEPFSENIGIPMVGAADGIYTVWLNGELIGEFSFPA
ncbi:MAG: hypothetical protein OEZ02_06645 [Anaerolineae bacterium]|nr:hypothetical protein [Anaerolineae bacterium]